VQAGAAAAGIDEQVETVAEAAETKPSHSSAFIN
jgi:hypothetical protein